MNFIKTIKIEIVHLKNCELMPAIPDLSGLPKWEFLFQKHIQIKSFISIKAFVADDDFLQKAKEGELKFSGRTKIICDLEIIKETMESPDKYEDDIIWTRYIVRNVTKVFEGEPFTE